MGWRRSTGEESLLVFKLLQIGEIIKISGEAIFIVKVLLLQILLLLLDELAQKTIDIPEPLSRHIITFLHSSYFMFSSSKSSFTCSTFSSYASSSAFLASATFLRALTTPHNYFTSSEVFLVKLHTSRYSLEDFISCTANISLFDLTLDINTFV